MAKGKDIVGSYSRREEPQDEKPSNRCPAHGCMMAASMFVDGGPWACRYHAKQPTENWQKVTGILHAQKRLLDIIVHADSIKPNEFDLLRDNNGFELEELLKPAPAGPGYPAETLKGWKCRVKDFVHAAIMHEISKIETQDKPVLQREISDAVAAFTNGTLRKNQRPLSFQSMAERRQAREVAST
jgi:hypothetical protein